MGRRPTFYDPADAPTSLVEAYLLDFDGDLYTERAAVSFVARLRDEQRFETVEDLVAQMHVDVAVARRLLEAPAGLTGIGDLHGTRHVPSGSGARRRERPAARASVGPVC